MGNRTFLYLSHYERTDDAVQFAEANGNFPTLWQLLLAGGEAGASITAQRVFGDTGSANLQAAIEPARARLATVRGFVERHADSAGMPNALRHLRALESHLAEVHRKLAAGGEWQLSADLEELSWLDDDADSFIERCVEACNDLWQQLQGAMESDDEDWFIETLELDEPDNWDAWRWSFGFGVGHPYFEADAPRTMSFEEYAMTGGEDAAIAPGISLFQEHGYWGVRRREADGNEGVVLLAAEWEAVLGAGHCVPTLLRVRRDGRYGLVEVGRNGARTLHPPTLTTLDEFVDTGDARLARAQGTDGMGLLQADGGWRFAPGVLGRNVEDLAPADREHVWLRRDGRWGLADAAGRWISDAFFDAVQVVGPDGLAVVARDGLEGLVHGDGREATPIRFDSIRPLGHTAGFEVQVSGKAGRLHGDGSMWIEPQWDLLEPVPGRGHLLALRDERWGLLDEDGTELIAPRFELLKPLEARHLPGLYLARDGKTGVVDPGGRVVVSFEYNEIWPFERVRQDGDSAMDHLLRVGIGQHYANRLFGTWSLRSDGEVVPCVYTELEAFAYSDGQGAPKVAYLAGKPLGKRRKGHGVLHEDGSELHPLIYRDLRIGDLCALYVPDELAAVAGDAWGDGKALLAEDFERRHWLLFRDGTVLPADSQRP